MRLTQFASFLLAAGSLTAASLPSSKPEDVGLSTERLQRIHTLVQKHMDLGDITGAVVLVARKGASGHPASGDTGPSHPP